MRQHKRSWMSGVGMALAVLAMGMFVRDAKADVGDVLTPYEWEINCQLLNENGTPLTGLQRLEMRLYDALSGGTLLWGRTVQVFADAQGICTAVMSDSAEALAGVPEAAVLRKLMREVCPYLEMTVAGNSAPIVPRQRVVAAPYAFLANAVCGSRADFDARNILWVVGESSARELSSGSLVANHVMVSNTLTSSGGLTASQGLTADSFAGLGAVAVGTVILWYGDAAGVPAGWAVCDGQNGTPDLRGRFPVGAGQGSGRSSYAFKDTGGQVAVTLTTAQIPAHDHGYELRDDNNRDCARGWDRDDDVWHGDKTASTSSAGGGQSHPNLPPYRALHYIMRVN